MAVFKSGVTGQIRGTIDGATYGNWHGIGVVRKKPQPPIANKGSQPSNRSRFGFLSRQFGVLDAANQAFWDAYAQSHPVPNKFGDPMLLTGANWFQKLNQEQMQAQGAVAVVMTQPPVSDPIASIDTLTPTDGVADGAVVLTPTINGTGLAADFLQVQVAGPFTSPAKKNVESFYTDLTTVDGDEVTVTVTGLQVNAWYAFRMRYLTLNNRPTNWVNCYHQAPDVA